MATIDICFNLPGPTFERSMTTLAVSSVNIKATRKFLTFYNWLGQPVILPGKAEGVATFVVEHPSLSIADGTRKLLEGVHKGLPFELSVGTLFKIRNCMYPDIAPEPVSGAPGALLAKTYSVYFSGEPAGSVSTSHAWIATGDYVLPSMPDLANLSASFSTDAAVSSKAFLNMGVMPLSAMPRTSFTISGTMYNTSRRPSDPIPLIENAPSDTGAAGAPLMSVSFGWDGSRQTCDDAINVESEFQLSVGKAGVELAAKRTFTIVPRLRPDSYPS